jgi:hypothetical protein
MRVLVQVILRLIDPKRVLNVAPKDLKQDFQSANQELDQTERMGFKNTKDQFCIRHCEVPKIQSHFNIFYLNKL